MAQPTDLTGMLTEGLFQPTQQAVPSSFQEAMIRQAQSAGTGLRRGIGALTGADTRTNPEAARAAMQGLDINNPADQPKLLEIVRKYAPEKESALVAQFAQQAKQRNLLEASMSSSTETRANVAKQLEQTHPALANAIIKEQASGKENALKAGLDIIKKKGETAKTVNLVDTRTDKTIGSAVERDGRLYLPGSSTPLTNEQLRGVGVSDSYVKPASALVTTKLTPQQEQEKSALQSQGNMFEITSGEVNPAIDKAASARQVLSTVNKGIATGIVPDFLANQGAILQGTLEAVGVTNIPTGISTGVLNQSELKNIQNKGMLPFIEQQGRGWTDTDRVNYYKTSAGYTQPWQYNEIVATADLQNSINTIEKHQFANTRKNLTTVTPLASTTLWNDYLKRVPRSKVIQDFEREGTGFTYDKVTVVDDGANLSQYWVEDEPIGFKMQLGDQIVDLDWVDVKDSAEDAEQTVREWLADREFAGHIIQGNY